MTRPILALVLVLAASTADAAPRRSAAPGRGATAVSLWGVVDPGPFDGVGVGGRLTFPLGGILGSPTVRDEFALELGADFIHYSDRVGIEPEFVDYSWNGFLLVGGLAWNFWLTPRFALYPKVDVGYFTGWYRGWDDRFGYRREGFDGTFVQLAGGAIFRLQTVSLRIEAGSGLLRLGVGFPF